MNKLFYKLVAVVLFLLVSTLSLQSAEPESGGWATVDTRILFMLHPLMVDFDYANGRFFRDSEPRRNVNVVFNQLQQARAEAAKEIEPLEEKIKELEQQRFSLVVERERAVRGFAPGDIERLQRTLAETKAALAELDRQEPSSKAREEQLSARRVNLLARLEKVQSALDGQLVAQDGESRAEKYRQALSANAKQIRELRDQIASIQDESVRVIFLTRKETAERIEKIRNEIDSLVKEAARESQIEVVIDNSFAMRSQERKDKRKMIPAVEDAPDVVASSMFHSFINLEFEPGLKEALREHDDSPMLDMHLEVGRSIGMRSNLVQYLEYRNYMPQIVTGFSHGRMFITGGFDMTPWVARKLFDRYEVPERLKTSYMMLLRNYLDFEREPSQREREY